MDEVLADTFYHPFSFTLYFIIGPTVGSIKNYILVENLWTMSSTNSSTNITSSTPGPTPNHCSHLMHEDLLMSEAIWSKMGVHSCDWFFGRDIAAIICFVVCFLTMLGTISTSIKGSGSDRSDNGGGLFICFTFVVAFVFFLSYTIAIIWEFVLMASLFIWICSQFIQWIVPNKGTVEHTVETSSSFKEIKISKEDM